MVLCWSSSNLLHWAPFTVAGISPKVAHHLSSMKFFSGLMIPSKLLSLDCDLDCDLRWDLDVKWLCDLVFLECRPWTLYDPRLLLRIFASTTFPRWPPSREDADDQSEDKLLSDPCLPSCWLSRFCRIGLTWFTLGCDWDRHKFLFVCVCIFSLLLLDFILSWCKLWCDLDLFFT